MRDHWDAIVVGSGPAGVSCARTLLKRSFSVLMIDAGLEAGDEYRISGQIDESRPRPPTLEELKPTTKGIPLKLEGQSAHPYWVPSRALSIAHEGGELRPSFAYGGFTPVWGRVVLPFAQDDLSAWPEAGRPAKTDYKEVAEWLEVYRQDWDGWETLGDELALKEFSHLPPPRNTRSERLEQSWKKSSAHLRASGIALGSSRIAKAPQTFCEPCSGCLSHCPTGTLWTVKPELERLKKNPRFRYLGRTLVERFEESAAGVKVHVTGLEGEPGPVHEGARLFLASGVGSTGGLLLRSMDLESITRETYDAAQYMMPLIYLSGESRREWMHQTTIAKALLELEPLGGGVLKRRTHLQLYGFNPLYVDLLAAKFAGLGLKLPASWVKGIFGPLLGRLGVVQGYMHSDDSPSLELNWTKHTNGTRLRVAPRADQFQEKSELTRRGLAEISMRLKRNGSRLGFFPLPGMAQLQVTGRGFHSGGSFPMRARPGRFETDVLGRLEGMERVHIVDASVFSSMPATTITLPLMANAARIARDAK